MIFRGLILMTLLISFISCSNEGKQSEREVRKDDMFVNMFNDLKNGKSSDYIISNYYDDSIKNAQNQELKHIINFNETLSSAITKDDLGVYDYGNLPLDIKEEYGFIQEERNDVYFIYFKEKKEYVPVLTSGNKIKSFVLVQKGTKYYWW